MKAHAPADRIVGGPGGHIDPAAAPGMHEALFRQFGQRPPHRVPIDPELGRQLCLGCGRRSPLLPRSHRAAAPRLRLRGLLLLLRRLATCRAACNATYFTLPWYTRVAVLLAQYR